MVLVEQVPSAAPAQAIFSWLFPPRNFTRTRKVKNIDLQPVDKRYLKHAFRGIVEATEEAIINALMAAETMQGANGNKFHELPEERIREIFTEYGKIFSYSNN